MSEQTFDELTGHQQRARMRLRSAVQLPDSPTMTVTEAAALLRVDKGAAYDAVRCGELPAIRVGRAIRIPTAKLAALLGIPHNDTTEATS